ncbi:hypothetical protein I302_104728 [Kwoniella bestiolae CBS 10118]|uniref:UDP-N-acetylglucosamine transferase subunit ALG13 n=1 Tax=Kwoniella bestiolae CBS 10118 TaxID=1296100 RepID=A0A1B9FRZ1_9TREE|nr:hypothetical protein I302_09201 [Kwoniella bestiolae CBS 10118]OCF21522.1 hypothetical protein I302_09201 [Kwoniella bestiolae CBS 10118]
MSTLLVTVGSTLFPTLTNTFLSPPILALLEHNRIKRLIVQYGRADLPLDKGLHIHLDGQGRGQVDVGGMRVEVLRFTDDFEGLIGRADWVVSHAGSGSILTTLRRDPPKPLLVVPNESLMDNHQSELADEMGERGYLMVSKVGELEHTLPKFLSVDKSTIKAFPQMDTDRFRNVLDEMMGFD